jgi:hypothetical protein
MKSKYNIPVYINNSYAIEGNFIDHYQYLDYNNNTNNTVKRRSLYNIKNIFGINLNIKSNNLRHNVHEK